MRTLIGRTPVVLARRWLRVERLAQLTLRRDAYAEPPGPSVTLDVGERTTYRAGAWLLDVFDRPALGSSYPPWGGTAGLTLVAGRVEPVAVGPVGMVTHTRPMPRDVWAAVEIAALSGASAVVGVLLRASETEAYRITATSAGQTAIERLGAGAPVGLLTVPTPWRAGDVLRAELIWNRLRVYREPILVADVVVIAPDTVGAPRLWDGVGIEWDAAGIEWDSAGPTGLTGRAVGLVAGRGVEADAAALTSFVAGEARQEYLGAGLDLGDVAIVLGEPVRFEVTLSNTAPLGGKDRFAALLRHGQNTAGTYDLDRGAARVLTVVQGGTAPLTAAVGVIDAPGALSEDRVRIQCRGRDAFLTPQLAAGVVTYLAGPPPGGLTPLPADPCAPSAPPVIIPGPLPPEPVDPPHEDGTGPEAPGDPPPPPDGGGVAIVTYGKAHWGSTGHIADPGNNPVTDSETNSPITRIVTLIVETLVSYQNAVGVINVGDDTWDERFAVFYITRTPSVLGSHCRVRLSLNMGTPASISGVSVGFDGTSGDPDEWTTAQDIRDAEPVTIGSPVPPIPHPVPGASWGPTVFELAVGAVRTLRLHLNATMGPLVGGDYAKAEATLTVQDVEFFTPPPTGP